jgi:hypothetical protein
MSERDELAKLLFVTDNDAAPEPEHEWEMTTRHNPAYAEYAFAMADAILAAGYRKPRTVATAEELDALPNGSIIRDDEGDGWQFFGLMGWFVTGGDKEGSESPTLPATVLYEAPND